MPVKASQLQRLYFSLLMELLLSSSYPYLAAGAYCSSSIGTTTVAPTSITSEIATGCTLAANSRLSLTGTSIPSLPTAGVVRMHFVSGTVAAGGFIQITGPPTATAATKVPLIVLISKNSFGNGAAVLVTGSFPPNSNITVSFNNFVSSTPCPLMNWLVVDEFVAVVAIAAVVPIVLNQGAEVNVQYNNINTNSGTAVHSMPLVVNAITFNVNSFARVKGNTFKSHGIAGTGGNTWILIYDPGTYIINSQTNSHFIYSGGGSWEIVDNWMQLTTTTVYYTVVSNAPMISAPQGGTFSFSRNYIKSVPLVSSIYPVNKLLTGPTLGNTGTNFNYLFIGNTVDAFIVDHLLETTDMTLAGNSRFEFSYNTFVSNTIATGFYVDFSTITIGGTSQLTVSNNRFRTLAGAAQSDSLQFHSGFTLAGSTTFTLSGNSIDAAVRTSPKKLFAMTSPSVSTSSRVTLCDTKYFGPRLSKFNYQISGNAGFLTLPIEYCQPTQSFSYTMSKTKALTLTRARLQTPSPLPTQSGSISGTEVPTRTLTPMNTMSRSASLSVSSSDRTNSHSHSVTSSASYSACESESFSRTSTPSHSISVTQSLSAFTSSGSKSKTVSPSSTLSTTGTLTQSTSLSKSNSISISPSSTQSPSSSSSPSISESTTCRDLGNLDVNNTCEVMRPLPIGATSRGPIQLYAHWRLGSGDCTHIEVPFNYWTGREGSMHSLAIVAVDSRVPFRSPLTPPIIAGSSVIEPVNQSVSLLPITLFFSTAEEVANATANGQLPGPPGAPLEYGAINVTFSYFVATSSILYNGKPTLNKIQYSLDCKAWARCPITMPGIMDVTLVASERLFPTVVAEAVAMGSTIVSLGGSVTFSPTLVAQLGVTTSLRQMSRCVGTELDDETDNDSYAEYGQAPLNPFGIVVGPGVGLPFIRGALAMSLVYLAALTFLMFLYTTAAAWSHWAMSGTVTSLPSLLSGYPSALVAVFAFAMDGMAGSGIILGVYGAGWADQLIGVLAVVLCFMYVSHILYVSIQIPLELQSLEIAYKVSEQRSCELEDQTFSLGLKIQMCRNWLVPPTNNLDYASPEETESRNVARWMSKYGSYIADSRVPWFCGLEQTVALVICVLGSLSIGELPFCITRGVLSVVMLGGLSVVMIVKRPPIHRWRWLLLSAVYVLQAVTAALSVANAPLQEQSIELGMDCLGVVISFLLGVAFVVDVVLLVRENYDSAKSAFVYLKKHLASADTTLTQREVDSFHDVIVFSDQLPPGDAATKVDRIEVEMEDSESSEVRAILIQLDEYEQSLVLGEI